MLTENLLRGGRPRIFFDGDTGDPNVIGNVSRAPRRIQNQHGYFPTSSVGYQPSLFSGNDPDTLARARRQAEFFEGINLVNQTMIQRQNSGVFMRLIGGNTEDDEDDDDEDEINELPEYAESSSSEDDESEDVQLSTSTVFPTIACSYFPSGTPGEQYVTVEDATRSLALPKVPDTKTSNVEVSEDKENDNVDEVEDLPPNFRWIHVEIEK